MNVSDNELTFLYKISQEENFHKHGEALDEIVKNILALSGIYCTENYINYYLRSIK
jgi:hypothetical protein